tara:strand:+ start:348 stop:674 length:327 start_codon:yes stop_codon:yes gene_type:complete
MKGMLLITIVFSTLAWADDQPPELWSWLKDLNKSKEACEIQSSYTLKALGLENQIENEYGIYGNVKSNRVVVKCIEISENRSKLMVAVAGNKKDSVAMVRNKIVKSIK